jgi:molecular chaperone GrpE
MLRQALATSSRALRSTPTIAASRAFLRPQIQNAAPAISIRAFQPIASRWYSENKEATETKEAPAAAEQKAEEKTESSEGDKNGETDAVAQLKKEIEAKDKEARDWKVCFFPPSPALSLSLSLSLHPHAPSSYNNMSC